MPPRCLEAYRMDDPKLEVGAFAELDAMKSVAQAIEPLEPDAKTRVLNWAFQFFELGGISSSTLTEAGRLSNDLGEEEGSANATNKPDSLGELYALADPISDGQKALVASYWIQVCLGNDSFGTQSVNGELKQLGYRITNVTRAFDGLEKSRPQLVIRLKKGGQTQQARKMYKLTEAGVKEVENMIKA